MHCDILDSFYLKPNGLVPCEDDIGEQITLGWIDNIPEPWSPTAFFDNERYRALKSAAQNNRLPWGETCRNCAHLQPRQWQSGLTKRKIRKLQIEPSMLCSLRCPACGNRELLRRSKGSRNLPLSLLERVLSGFRREGYTIDYVEYAGQGDPLMHPEFDQIVKTLRRYFPSTRQRIITNGNYDFQKSLKDAFVEDVVISCDGAIQENYQQYRINGRVEKVFQFMRDARSHSPKTHLIWKYILFEFNDSDTEIRLAQQIAMQTGVQEMRFVVTATEYRSERFHLANAHLLPVLHPRLSVRLNPLVSRIDQMGSPTPLPWLPRAFHSIKQRLSSLPNRFIASTGFGRIFTTIHRETKHLVVEAWILFAGPHPATPFHLFVDGQQRATQETPLDPQSPLERAIKRLGLHLYRLRLSCIHSEPLPQTAKIEIRQAAPENAVPLLSRHIAFTPSLQSS